MGSSRYDDFRISFSYPGGNKGKSIKSASGDLLEHAIYDYRLEGEFLGREGYIEWEVGDEKYTSLQSYSIHIQSKLKKRCSLLQFLRFWDGCVDITGKIVLGYMDVDVENQKSRKRFSSGLKEGVITKKITNFKKQGSLLILDFDGFKAKINIERAAKELLLSIDNDGDGKVDGSGYNYEWQIDRGDSDVHTLEGDLDAYIVENFKPQASNSNDFLSDRKASLRGLFQKVANEAIDIPLLDFGDAKFKLVEDGPNRTYIAGFMGDFNDVPALKDLRIGFITNKNTKKIKSVLPTIGGKFTKGAAEFKNNVLSFTTENDLYIKITFKSDLEARITSYNNSAVVTPTDFISSASYADAFIIKTLKMYCISESNIKKFPNVEKVINEFTRSTGVGSSGSTIFSNISYDKAIKLYQKNTLGFSDRQVDGIFGPKSYSSINLKDNGFFEKLMNAFAQDAGIEENINPESIARYYKPKFIRCPGKRRSRSSGVEQKPGGTSGKGRSEPLGSLTSKKDCEKEYAELISTDSGKEKVRNALISNAEFMTFYKKQGSDAQRFPMKVLADYIKKGGINITPECFVLNLINKPAGIGSLPSGRGGGDSFKALPAETQEQIEGCSGEEWTKEDVSGLLKAIITGKTTGLNIGQNRGFTAQVLNPNKLKNKFKDLLRKRKKGLDFPFLRSNKFYLNIIEDMSEDLAGYMNAFVKQDAKEIRNLLGKKEYEYLSDEKASPSIGRYCKTGFKRQDRSRLFMGFADLVNKNPMAIDSLAKKYIVKGYKDLDRMAPNLREFDTTDVRYNQDTWNGKAHDKTSGNILNDLVKLSNHLDSINEKAFSDRIEDIILETLEEK